MPTTYTANRTHGVTRRISRQQHLRGIFQSEYTVSSVGICGTCGCRAAATGANEGYSDCCNDRIEYGYEAAETLQERISDQHEWIAELTKKIASKASSVSVARRNGADDSALVRELASLRQSKKWAKVEVKALAKTLNEGGF